MYVCMYVSGAVYGKTAVDGERHAMLYTAIRPYLLIVDILAPSRLNHGS